MFYIEISIYLCCNCLSLDPSFLLLFLHMSYFLEYILYSTLNTLQNAYNELIKYFFNVIFFLVNVRYRIVLFIYYGYESKSQGLYLISISFSI